MTSTSDFFSLNVTWPLRFKQNSSAIRIQYHLIHDSDCSHVAISVITLLFILNVFVLNRPFVELDQPLMGYKIIMSLLDPNV